MTNSINTILGTVKGRDTIFLSDTVYNDSKSELTINGKIDSTHCSNNLDLGDLAFTFQFNSVLAYKMIELDSWILNSKLNLLETSAFFEIQNSKWINTLKGKVTKDHKHIVVQTYDDVFEIICKDYKIKIKS